MSADSRSAAVAAGPPPIAPGQQEFGTLWIQDQHGVSQMIRVVQAPAAPTTPAKTATVVSSAPSATVPAAAVAAASTSGAPCVVRAIIKTATPAGPATQVVRRTVQLHPAGQGTTVIARPGGRTMLATGSRAQILTISPQRPLPTVLPASPLRRTVVAGRRLPVTPKRRVVPSGPALAGQTVPVAQTVPTQQTEPAATPPPPPPARAQPAQLGRAAFISPILDHSGARKRQTESDMWSEGKRRRTEKSSKGLRHFSMKVCEKVRTKGITTYNEVADELVAEFSEPGRCDSPSDQQCDQKNIRRRVYDALNVLMAMNIISKEKKEIKWLGLPTNSLQECKNLEREKAQRMHRINVKTQQLKDLILQQIAFKNLVERNRNAEEQHGPPPANSTVQLPFIIVNTSKQTVIDCSISNDKMEYLFNFNDTFEIHDDIEVLKRMGLALGLENGTCREEDVDRAKATVPPSLAPYIEQMAREGGTVDLEAALSTRGLGSGTSTSERDESVTPSIDFDTDDEEELDEELDVDD